MAGAFLLAGSQAPAQTFESFTLERSMTVGGDPILGTVTFSGLSRTGATVQLSSSAPGVASVPTQVFVGGSGSSATFTISTQTVNRFRETRITAVYGTVMRTAILNVIPGTLINFDDLSAGTSLANQYSSRGATFAFAGASPVRIINASSLGTFSGTQALEIDTSGDDVFPPHYAPLKVRFANPMSFVSVRGGSVFGNMPSDSEIVLRAFAAGLTPPSAPDRAPSPCRWW
jgi:hypothetical protein